MSEWYSVEADDVEIDREAKEVNVFVTANDNGNVYLTMTFEQVKKLADAIA